MTGYWPGSFLRVYGPRRSRGPLTRKLGLDQYPATLTEKAWPIKDYVAFGEIFLVGHGG